MLTVKFSIENYDGEIRVVDAMVGYLGVYKITREYGGPEEGGWWYDHRNHILSMPMIRPGDEEEIKEIQKFLEPRFKNWGNIGSTKGGAKYEFRQEAEQGQFETIRPKYE